jgi:hypothetical protein
MSPPDSEKPAGSALVDRPPETREREPTPPSVKPLPPPPPIARLPKGQPVVAAKPVAKTVLVAKSPAFVPASVDEPQITGSGVKTAIGFGLIGTDSSVVPTGGGGPLNTVVGMPVPDPGASPELPSSEPRQPIHAIATPLSLPMNELHLPNHWKRSLIIGAVAVLGLMMGFSLVVRLSTRRGSTEPAAGMVLPPSPVALAEGVAVSDPVGMGKSPATSAGDPPATPSVVPEATALPAATTPDPETAPVSARPALATDTRVAKPPSPESPVAVKSAPSRLPAPAPAAPPSGTCKPPYRVDFFGKKVLKPGCSWGP